MRNISDPNVGTFWNRFSLDLFVSEKKSFSPIQKKKIRIVFFGKIMAIRKTHSKPHFENTIDFYYV